MLKCVYLILDWEYRQFKVDFFLVFSNRKISLKVEIFYIYKGANGLLSL